MRKETREDLTRIRSLIIEGIKEKQSDMAEIAENQTLTLFHIRDACKDLGKLTERLYEFDLAVKTIFSPEE